MATMDADSRDLSLQLLQRVYGKEKAGLAYWNPGTEDCDAGRSHDVEQPGSASASSAMPSLEPLGAVEQLPASAGSSKSQKIPANLQGPRASPEPDVEENARQQRIQEEMVRAGVVVRARAAEKAGQLPLGVDWLGSVTIAKQELQAASAAAEAPTAEADPGDTEAASAASTTIAAPAADPPGSEAASAASTVIIGEAAEGSGPIKTGPREFKMHRDSSSER